MQEYVVGFLFDDRGSHLALLLKQKGPSHVVGKWNAPGGKIEQGEHPHDAIIREFEEETGVRRHPWMKFLTLDGNNGADYWRVYFYSLFDTTALSSVKTMEEEEIRVFYVPLLHNTGIVENLKWAIPMALEARKTGAEFLVVEECG